MWQVASRGINPRRKERVMSELRVGENFGLIQTDDYTVTGDIDKCRADMALEELQFILKAMAVEGSGDDAAYFAKKYINNRIKELEKE